MPTYRYQAVDDTKCDFCPNGFEVFQPIAENALTKCPKCEAKVERVIGPVGINLRPSSKTLLRDDNLKKHGFKKLVKDDSGQYVDVLSKK